MIPRRLTLRVASLLVATASLMLVAGCNSGPHQQPANTAAATSDPKDAKDNTPKQSRRYPRHPAPEPMVGNPGPHQ